MTGRLDEILKKREIKSLKNKELFKQFMEIVEARMVYKDIMAWRSTLNDFVSLDLTMFPFLFLSYTFNFFDLLQVVLDLQ